MQTSEINTQKIYNCTERIAKIVWQLSLDLDIKIKSIKFYIGLFKKETNFISALLEGLNNLVINFQMYYVSWS